MKIIVTGGAGFIGSNFIRYLMNNYDDEIINLDKLTYAGNLENLEDISHFSNYHFYKGDILNKNLVEKIFRREPDYLVNFAAETHVDRSFKNSGKFIKTNVEGTQNLLEVSHRYNLKKFVQVSTDEVYGPLGKKGSFTEESSLNPTNPYAASKAGADLITLSYYKTFNLPVNITRSSNNFGPYQFPEKIIPLFIIRALQNKKLPLYGDGRNIRQWLYVADHCRAIDRVMREGKPGAIYNISSPVEKTNLELTKMILKRMDKPCSLINFVEDRQSHDYRYALDYSRIKNNLNWQPKMTFRKGLRKTIEWYCRHQDWWNKLI